jgi:hypothetical protein
MIIVKRILITVAFVALAIFFLGLNMTYQPLAVTNPDDSRFDPRQFRFSNYSHKRGNEPEFNKALLRMFPPGTDRAYVEEILVQQGHAVASLNRNSPDHKPGETDYTYVWGSWLVNFVFDSDNKSVAMITAPSRPLYGINRYLLQFEREKQHERRE